MRPPVSPRTSRFGALSFGALCASFVLLAALAPAASAQTGKITGTVTDAATGDPLPGVNVVLEGTTIGTSTNFDGDYTIIGIRPGTYDLIASFIGFETTRIQGVRIQIDLTTEIDIRIREEVLEGEEVVIIAERPLVQKDLTATTSVVSGDEIRAIPVENFGEVVNLQAGVVDGHFRGGRLGEVGYWVDGMPVTDVYSGGLGIAIENNSVEELQVVTGAFNAEYGQAMSGIVNVVTRDGSNEYSGTFSGFAGDYASTNTDIFPETGLGNADPFAVRNAELSLSGPILKNRLFFFASGRYFHNDGWIYGRDAFKADDVGLPESGGAFQLLNPSGSGDSSVVALNPYDRLSGQAKLTLRLTRNIRVSANVIASQDESMGGGQDLLLFPDGRTTQQTDAYNVYFKWTHTLSNTTFYDAGFTNSYTSYESYQFEDPFDERYRDNNFFGVSEPSQTAGFRVGGTNNGRFSRSTGTILGKIDVTSQLNATNLAKMGIEFRRHRLQYNDDFVDVNSQNPDAVPEIKTSGRYTYEPTEIGAYVQDKVELGSLIINMGLRFDYFDSRGRLLSDPTSQDVVYPANRPDELTAFTIESDSKWQFSPRLGVAFPISADGVVHFSYGWFFQRPNFELLYQNPFFNLDNSGSGLIGLLGNANLEAEKTVNGEIGLKQQLNSTSAVEVTAYYRDIRGLTGTAADPVSIVGTSDRYGILRNSDFGFVRGLVLRYDQRIGDGIFAGVDYTYQVAKANASDPSQAYSAAAAKGELEKIIVSTNWDQRHTANFSLTYAAPSDWGFGLVGSFGSGQPFTPSISTVQSGNTVPTRVLLNSEIKPSTARVNFNAYKNVSFGGAELQVFTKIDNLFDRANEYGVFGDTGRATYSLQRNLDARQFRGDPRVLDRAYNRTDFFDEPRRIVLGLRVSF